MAVIQSTQQPFQSDEKKKNEQQHNAATPNILPIQRDPLQPVQMVKQPPNIATTMQQPQPQQPVTGPQLLQQGQTMAAGGVPQTPLQQAYTQKATEFVQDPNMGKNYQAETERQLREYDIGRAKATEAAREQVAPFLQSGKVRRDFTDDIIQRAMDRSKLEGELRTGYDELQRRNLMDALSAAQTATESQRLGYQTGIDAISKMVQAGEGGEQRKFAGAENAFNRMHELAMQTNSIAAQKEIENIRADLARGLQMDEQSFKRIESALNRDLQAKLQSDDINARMEALQTQLQFDRWKTEAGMELTRAENAANRALEITLQDKDMEFQDKMIRFKEKSAMDMLITTQEFNAIQNDLDRKIQEADISSRYELMKLKNEFEAQQEEQRQKHAEYLQTAQFDQEKWMNNRAETLTRAGWNRDDAQREASRDHEKFLATFNGELEKELALGRQTFEAEQNASERAIMIREASLDRQLQREVEFGRISIEEMRLLQNAQQFTSQQDFERWAIDTKLEADVAARLWQSKENASDRAHDMRLQVMEKEFAEKGMNLSAVIAQLQSENIHSEQAAAMIGQMAVDAGITYVDDNGVTQAGLKPIDREILEKKQLDAQMTEIIDKAKTGQKISLEDYDIMKQSDMLDVVPETFEDRVFSHYTQDARNSKVGYRAWRFDDDVWNWVNENKGNVMRASDGEVYRIESFWEPGQNMDDKHKRAFITLKSLKTGDTIRWYGGKIREDYEKRLKINT